MTALSAFPQMTTTTAPSPPQCVRIGCSSAFWGDSVTAAAQLVKHGRLKYLVADYLAEVTMGILAKRRQRARSAAEKTSAGYVGEFVTFVWKPLMADILRQGVRVVTNAGGLDPHGLKVAIEEAARDAGLQVNVAAVVGDDIRPRYEELRSAGKLRKFAAVDGDDEAWPAEGVRVESLNAYLGAEPIQRALAGGAQVVVTGRCVDSALVLGPLMHEYGWSMRDYDRLAAGSLAGHIIECGCQATGGNFTDWRSSAFSEHGGWSNMGYPVVEVRQDGSFVVGKPDRTGGVVSVTSVGEQMLYEIGDPGAYILPDVIVDLRDVQLKQLDKNLVEVSGVRGRAPTPFLKVSGVYMDGYKVTGELFIGGADAREKALAVGHAIVTRVRGLLKKFGLEDFKAVNIEALGTEHTYGPRATAGVNSREVVLRLSAHHTEVRALRIFLMEIAPSATCMAPGIIGVTSGRPRPQGNMVHYSLLVEKSVVQPAVIIGNQSDATRVPFQVPDDAHPSKIPPPSTCIAPYKPPSADSASSQDKLLIYVPLIKLCVARSGDKGDSANVGVMVRDMNYYPYLSWYLTEQRVHQVYEHLMAPGTGRVIRYQLPGCGGFNFLVTRSLGGGGLSSLHVDRQAKSYAQMLLALRVPVPSSWFGVATPEKALL